MVPLVTGAPTAVIPGDHLDYRDRLAAFAQVPVLSAAPVTDPTVAQVLSVTPPPRLPILDDRLWGTGRTRSDPDVIDVLQGLRTEGPLPKFSISGDAKLAAPVSLSSNKGIVAGLKVSSVHGFRP